MLLKRVIRLIESRFRLGFDNWCHMLGFLMNLAPPINYSFAVLCKIIARHEKNTIGSRVYFAMLGHGIGWGALRHIDPTTKTIVAKNLRNYHLREKQDDDQSINNDSKYKSTLKSLKDQGYASLGIVFDSQEVSDALKFFSEHNYFSAQVSTQGVLKSGRSFLEDYEEGESRYRSILPSASLECPQIKRFLQLPMIKSITKLYLGMEVPVYSVNTFATFPGYTDHYVMRKHRDYDHFLSLTFFIAWTETAYDDGATLYIPGSHKLVNDAGRLVSLDARAGEVFAIDTFGQHSGNSNLKKARISSWVRYGTMPNLGWLQDGNSEFKP